MAQQEGSARCGRRLVEIPNEGGRVTLKSDPALSGASFNRLRTRFEPAPPPSNFQPFLGSRLEGRGRAFPDDLAVAHHVEPVTDLKRDRQLLLDQQDRDAA